jgi:hypothetical protein
MPGRVVWSILALGCVAWYDYKETKEAGKAYVPVWAVLAPDATAR